MEYIQVTKDNIEGEHGVLPSRFPPTYANPSSRTVLFYDIDRGVEPDYALTSAESFYDRQGLTDYINSPY